jgi:hypothetical protein
MKKLSIAFIVALVLAGISFADSNTVASANVLGYTKRVLLPGKYTLIGINFDANNGNPTLKDVLGTNQLKAAANYLDADRVVLWNKQTSSYQAYAQYDGDREFYPCNNATEWNTSSSTNPTIPMSTGFWIISGSSTTNTLLLSGSVVTNASKQINIANGYQLIAWPFSSGQAVSTMTVTNLTKAANYLDADRIAVWDGDHYQQYGLFTDGDWYPCNTATEWNNAIAETDRVISLGEGFWFIGISAKTITETSPYYENIQ